MKRNLSSLTLLLLLFAAISCSDDSNSTHFYELEGKWVGETIFGSDTATYSCEITEARTITKGTGELYGHHRAQYSNMTIDEESRRFTRIVGAFDSPNIGIRFDGDSVNHFEGQLSEDKLSMNGTVKIRFAMIDTLIEYPIVLYKKYYILRE